MGDAPVASVDMLHWPMARIADRDGVSRQSVSKMVARLATHHGLRVIRTPQGHVQSVDVAHYDHLRAMYADPSKGQRPALQPPPAVAPADPAPPRGDSYDEALRQKTWQEVERRRLDLEVARGRLINAEATRSALVTAGVRIADLLLRIESEAETVQAASNKDGIAGARRAMRAIAQRLAADIAQALEQALDEAPQEDLVAPAASLLDAPA